MSSTPHKPGSCGCSTARGLDKLDEAIIWFLQYDHLVLVEHANGRFVVAYLINEKHYELGRGKTIWKAIIGGYLNSMKMGWAKILKPTQKEKLIRYNPPLHSMTERLVRRPGKDG
jgi:hypothetical protein